MAIQVKISRQLSPGSATTQDFTDGDLTEDVKAALVVLSNSITTTGGSETHLGIGFGMGAGTGVGDGSQFAQSAMTRPLVSGREVQCDESIIAFDSIQVTPGSRATFASLSAFIANGFTLSYSISTNQATIAGVGFGGSDLTVASGVSGLGSGDGVVDTGLSNVDLVLVMGGGRFGSGLFDNACGSSTGTTVGMNLGAVAKTQAGAIQQAAITWGSTALCRVSASRCYITSNFSSPGPGAKEAQVTDITGGRVTFASVGSGDYAVADFAWVAFDFGGQALATVQTFTTDRTDSTKDVDLEMIPTWAMVLGTHITALDTTDLTADAVPFSIGMIDRDEQNVAAVAADDNAAPGTEHSYTRSGEIWATMAEGGASFSNLATGSLSGTNLSLNFTTHDTTADRLGIVIAIGSPGDIAVDEQVEVSDEVSLLRTDLEATPQDTVEVSDSVDLVLTDVELELEPNQKPKGTARAGPDASQAYGG